MDRIRVVLADDQILFVESLKNVLETRTKDIKVIGIAYDGEEAIKIIENQKPDIILMDVRMPNINGVEATKIIHKNHPGIGIIMLTTFNDDEYIHEALSNGAMGYLLKNIPPIELISSIRAVRSGSILISPTVAKKLVNVFPQERDSSNVENEFYKAFKKLSNREKEVLKCISQGLTNKQIADALFISDQTVKNYISIIYSKIGNKNRFEIMEITKSFFKDKPLY